MVENNNIAVIFTRKIICENEVQFIPIEIVEGYYNEKDKLFVDIKGNGYHHIGENYQSGNVYAIRYSSLELLQKYPNKTYEQIKNSIYTLVKSCKFLKKDNQLFIISPEGENKLFKDKDCEITQKDELLPISKDTREKQDVHISPQKVCEELKKTVVGQDDGIKKIVTTIIKNITCPSLTKKNMLIIGQTGVGKTTIFKNLSKIINVPITIFSIPGLTQSGYVGSDVQDILKKALNNCNYDIKKVENSIIVLDEIDKINRQENDGSGKVATEGVQNELLTILEGDIRTVYINKKLYTIDTSKITFIGVGAFQELYDKEENKQRTIGFNDIYENDSHDINETSNKQIFNHGMKKELIGRLPVIIRLRNLTKEDYINILKLPEGELSISINELEKKGIKCHNIDLLYDKIAEETLKKGIGARGLNAIIENIFNDIFYYILSYPNEYAELIIGENILEDETDYQLIPHDRNTCYKKRILINDNN